MKTVTLSYGLRYTTSGGAHRYSPRSKAKVNIGDIYLRGVATPPEELTVTVEAK